MTGLAKLDTYTLVSLVVCAPLLYDFFHCNVEVSIKYLNELDHDLYETWLTPIIGRKMDLKDSQWKNFRAAMPMLSLAFAIQILVRKAFPNDYVGAAIGIIWMVFLHRIDSIFLFAMFACNFALLTRVPRGKRNGVVPIVWAGNLAVLFAVKRYGNFIHPNLMLDWFDGTELGANKSMLPWWLTFNLMFLRLISLAEDSTLTTANDLLIAVFYLCYPPLYIAGPIIRFHDFKAQVQGHQARMPARDLLSYAIRFAFLLLSFEGFSSYCYCTALARNLQRHALQVEINTLEDIKATMLWSVSTLFGAWFKFALIWRFSRLFALLDGINPPENMRGCIASTVSFRVFWKEWHSSFNAWLVRYMYIPLGGNKQGAIKQALASFVCFLFVAAWHDFEMRMAVWGLGICLALVPEIIGHAVANNAKWALRMQREMPYAWDAFAAVFGGVAILALLFVNMFGFSLHETTWVLISKARETNSAGEVLVYALFWTFMCAFLKLGKRRREAAATALEPHKRKISE